MIGGVTHSLFVSNSYESGEPIEWTVSTSFQLVR
jgi:hypothetical protein